jgi:hypothetical protein
MEERGKENGKEAGMDDDGTRPVCHCCMCDIDDASLLSSSHTISHTTGMDTTDMHHAPPCSTPIQFNKSHQMRDRHHATAFILLSFSLVQY